MFYSVEEDMFSFDKESNSIKWSGSKPDFNFSWIFENLEIASDEELQRYKVVYGLEENSDLSKNSQNLIGVHRILATQRFSEYYNAPVKISGEGITEAGEKDLVLLFESKEDPEISTILVFDVYDMCKYVIHYYPTAYYDSMKANYIQFYGDHANRFKWHEQVGSKKYIYQFLFFDEKFGVEVKKDFTGI